MSPTEVAARLDERFRLLTGKRRGRVERHQTLRATVEWSYQLLEEDERTVFDRLGVFAGTFDASAAIAVAGGDDVDSWAVTDTLGSLVGKSMLVTETGADGTTRYSLLETLRQFARERLDEEGHTDGRRRALAEHYARVAREIGLGLIGADHIFWLERLRDELDNLRAAVSWALELQGVAEQRLALQILASLEPTVQGDPVGLGALALQAVDAAEAAPPELRAPVLTLAAYSEWNGGRTERARVLAHAALECGVVTATVQPLAPYVGAVVFEMAAGNHARALEIADDARAVVDTVDSPYAQAACLAGIGNFTAMAGNFEQARADTGRALAIARASQNVEAIAMSLLGRMWALQRVDPPTALAAAEEYLDLYHEFGVNAGGAASALAVAGSLRARLGNASGALEHFYDAVVLARDLGVRPQLAATLDYALQPLLRAGRSDVASTFLGALTDGALAGQGGWPGVAAARAKALERCRDALGDELAVHVGRGSTMSYDELVDYSIAQLEPGSPASHGV
jgi:tetratricopeptide (TPR) repeat protein